MAGLLLGRNSPPPPPTYRLQSVWGALYHETPAWIWLCFILRHAAGTHAAFHGGVRYRYICEVVPAGTYDDT